MKEKDVLQCVLGQIQAAKKALDDYSPSGFNWYSRAKKSAAVLVPWLVETAPGLKNYVEAVLNSRQEVRRLWSNVEAELRSHSSVVLVRQIAEQLKYEAVLLDCVRGNVVSKVIEKHLIEHFSEGSLESNGESDYPDLFLRS